MGGGAPPQIQYFRTGMKGQNKNKVRLDYENFVLARIGCVAEPQDHQDQKFRNVIQGQLISASRGFLNGLLVKGKLLREQQETLERRRVGRDRRIYTAFVHLNVSSYVCMFLLDRLHMFLLHLSGFFFFLTSRTFFSLHCIQIRL